MSDDYKKWDSDDNYVQHNARLAFDADVIKLGDGKKLVKLKFTSEAKGQDKEGNDRYQTIWVEAIVGDYDADKAAYLKKGDVLTIEGKPGLRLWGDDNDKISFELIRARLHMPLSLFSELKDRGFAPGGKGGKGKAAPKKGKKSTKKIVEIPEDDDEGDDGEDGDE
jgi:single-stranded DNA-binding protein